MATDQVEWGAWGGEGADPAEPHQLSTVTMKGEKEDAQKVPEGTHRAATTWETVDTAGSDPTWNSWFRICSEETLGRWIRTG